jgi:Putative helicase
MRWRWWQKYPQETVRRSDSKVRRAQDFLQVTLFNEAVSHIRSLVSCPPAPFATLYEQTLQNVAQLTQEIPHTTDKQSASYFTHAVGRAVKALMLRREKLLPEGACAEQIAEEDAVWTFAIFSSALCHGFMAWAWRWRVQWCVSAGDGVPTWHNWSPGSGYLPEEAMYYRWQGCVEEIKPDELMAVRQGFVTALMVPLAGVQWLQGFAPLWRYWWQVLAGNAEMENPLWDILQQAIGQDEALVVSNGKCMALADEAVQEVDVSVDESARDIDDKTQATPGQALDTQETATVEPEDTTNALASTFLSWLGESIDRRRLILNQPHAEIFTLAQGLFVTLNVLQTFGAQSNADYDPSTLIATLQEADALWLEEGRANIHRVHLSLRPPAVLRGVVVLLEHLSVTIEDKPYRFLKPTTAISMEGGTS